MVKYKVYCKITSSYNLILDTYNAFDVDLNKNLNKIYEVAPVAEKFLPSTTGFYHNFKLGIERNNYKMGDVCDERGVPERICPVSDTVKEIEIIPKIPGFENVFIRRTYNVKFADIVVGDTIKLNDNDRIVFSKGCQAYNEICIERSKEIKILDNLQFVKFNVSNTNGPILIDVKKLDGRKMLIKDCEKFQMNVGGEINLEHFQTEHINDIEFKSDFIAIKKIDLDWCRSVKFPENAELIVDEFYAGGTDVVFPKNVSIGHLVWRGREYKNYEIRNGILIKQTKEKDESKSGKFRNAVKRFGKKINIFHGKNQNR
ncbi:MAG: hypothetical protein MJ187_04515 [Alphaproteobacteria bacterium]|nr:hypothetical protein [Alphaproteobacteria bacterium]